MKTVIWISFMAILSTIDLLKLAKLKQRKDFWILLSWLALAAVYGELLVLKVRVPSLNRVLSDTIEWIVK
ncbi:MAG: hypothetical protein K0R75_417 [Paenibacillaceae bacterium]|nr:hypothetical protein [Paenibacillaceae bacterium]